MLKGANMKEMAECCHWCGKYIHRGSGFKNYQLGNRFCDDSCRNKYHNAKKKVKQQKQVVLGLIDFFQEMRGKDGELAEAADHALRLIAANTANTVKKIVCKECGQGRFTVPSAGDKCSFCKSENWSVR
jgi:hypothetical protein